MANSLLIFRRRDKGRGFTAVETLVATAILAIVATTVSGALSAGRAQSKNAQNMIHASMLARALMDEITRLPLADPNGYTSYGPDPGNTTRALYDNVDDYHNYSDGPTGLTDIGGTAYSSEFQGFTRTVTVVALSQSPTNWGRTINGVIVTVTVQKSGATLATLQRYVSQ